MRLAPALLAALVALAAAPGLARAEDPIRSFGTSGDGDGQFESPTGIAVDANGYVYVADVGLRRLTKFTPDGTLVRVIGDPDESFDGGELRVDELEAPTGVAVAPDGSLFVAESAGHTRISVWTPNGAFVRAFADQGSAPGQLSGPRGIAIAPDGTVYVADNGNDRVAVFAADGTFQRLIGEGAGGFGLAGLDRPGGVAVDADGSIWVTDGTWDELKHYGADGSFVGALSIDGNPGFQDGAAGLAIGPGHVFHVAHTPSSLVRRWSDAGVQGTPVGNGQGNQPGQTSRPEYVAFDCRGRLYVSDAGNDRVQVFGDAAAAPCGTLNDRFAATLDGAATQRFRLRFAVVVRPECPGRACTATLSGTVAIRGRKPVALVPRTVRLGQTGRDLMVEAGVAGAGRILAALKAGRRVTATVRLRAVDAGGQVATARAIVRLR